MTEVLKTEVKREVRSVGTIEELDALFARIKQLEPERYARLEKAGEYENQIKVLGLVKEEKKKK